MRINHFSENLNNLSLRIKEEESTSNEKLALKLSRYVNTIRKIKEYNLVVNEYNLKIDDLVKSLN